MTNVMVVITIRTNTAHNTRFPMYLAIASAFLPWPDVLRRFPSSARSANLCERPNRFRKAKRLGARTSTDRSQEVGTHRQELVLGLRRRAGAPGADRRPPRARLLQHARGLGRPGPRRLPRDLRPPGGLGRRLGPHRRRD